MLSPGFLDFGSEDEDVWTFSERIARDIVTFLDDALSRSRKQTMNAGVSSKIQDRLASLREDMFLANLSLNILECAEETINKRKQCVARETKQCKEELSILSDEIQNKLPHLPMEVITNIVSFLPSRARMRNSRDGEVHGWLPHVIVDPRLRLLADIDVKRIDKEVLLQTTKLESVDFSVLIYTFSSAPEIMQENLDLLLQFPERWKELRLSWMHEADMIPLLGSCKPCFQYIEDLYISDSFDYSLDSGKLISSFQGEVRSNVKTASLPRVFVQPFLRLGLLNALVDLTFHCEFYDVLYDSLRSLHLLSGLTALRRLRIVGYDWEEELEPDEFPTERYPPVFSESLQCLEIDVRIEHFASTFLELFRACPIDSIGVRMDIRSETIVEVLDIHFPALKRLIILKGYYDQLCPIELSGTYVDGTFPLPMLERIDVTFARMPRSRIKELEQYILEGLRARSDAPGVVRPIKHVSLMSNMADPLFQYELERLVPSVVFVKSVE